MKLHQLPDYVIVFILGYGGVFQVNRGQVQKSQY